MGQSVVTVDAFTSVPFTGNPAAVCVLSRERDAGWMQRVAKEMNLSETAFLTGRRAAKGEASYDLRWFTPTVEVDLCGHATVASAHVLWEDGHADPKKRLSFHTRSGLLTAEREKTWIKLDFPAAPVRAFDGPTDVLSKALGSEPTFVGAYGQDYLAELDGEDLVRGLSPDLALLKTLPVRGVAVTSRPGPLSKAKGFDFVSRFFAPAAGVPEDPVTGSAHCGLGPFWAERTGKEELVGYQASSRGGVVRVKVRGDRVELGGQAVTIMRAELDGRSA